MVVKLCEWSSQHIERKNERKKERKKAGKLALIYPSGKGKATTQIRCREQWNFNFFEEEGAPS
jgi:hypothetical protein